MKPIASRLIALEKVIGGSCLLGLVNICVLGVYSCATETHMWSSSSPSILMAWNLSPCSACLKATTCSPFSLLTWSLCSFVSPPTCSTCSLVNCFSSMPCVAIFCNELINGRARTDGKDIDQISSLLYQWIHHASELKASVSHLGRLVQHDRGEASLIHVSTTTSHLSPRGTLASESLRLPRGFKENGKEC